jgi:cytochrome c-type biogenesis protein
MTLSLPLAFLAGLLSMLSPCVFALVPAYLGYLSGTGLADERPAKTWRVFSHALAFVLGFTFILVTVIGLPTTLLSRTLQRYSPWLTRAGGLLLIVFALHTLGLIEIPMLDVSRHPTVGVGGTPSYARSALLGVTFAAGWSPCVGPLLGMVITLSLEAPARAMGYVLAYALGLAVPFLLAALLLARLIQWMPKFTQTTQTLRWISGGLILIVGLLLMLTGRFPGGPLPSRVFRF